MEERKKLKEFLKVESYRKSSVIHGISETALCLSTLALIYENKESSC